MKKAPAQAKPAVGGAAVDAFLANLSHPLQAEIAEIRRLVVGAAPGITEEIKWNAPGFRTTESFATVHLRAETTLQLIFHLGAKVRAPMPVMTIADPGGLMRWLGPDRALVTAGTLAEIRARKDVLEALVRAWIAYV